MDHKAYDEIFSYINKNPIAIVGTINPDGTPHGASVYICGDSHKPIVYFLTKQDTRKYRNIQSNNTVSLTIVNPAQNSTLQASGHATEIDDPRVTSLVMDQLARKHVSTKEWLPPIAKIQAGAYVVMSITLTDARLARFKGMVMGDTHIFTKL